MDEINCLSDELHSRVCLAQEHITDEEKLTAEEVAFATQTAISSMTDQVFVSVVIQYPTDEAACFITAMRDMTTLVHVAAKGVQHFRVFKSRENPAAWITEKLAGLGVEVSATAESLFSHSLH